MALGCLRVSAWQPTAKTLSRLPGWPGLPLGTVGAKSPSSDLGNHFHPHNPRPSTGAQSGQRAVGSKPTALPTFSSPDILPCCYLNQPFPNFL